MPLRSQPVHPVPVPSLFNPDGLAASEALPEDRGGEGGKRELATPAPGLGNEPVEPLHLQPEDPGGGALAAPGEEVENAPYADSDGDT